MSTANKTTGTIRIYACGGAAINVASVFESCRGQEEIGTASVEVVYLDTSSANFSSGVPVDQRYVVPGDKDGSGGDRRENSSAISQHVLEILQKFPPAYCNIVVSSGSGGSGSVVAPYLTSKLLGQDLLTIPMVIGDARQGHWIKNTLGTLATYENIATKLERAIPVAYFENSKEAPPSAVDTRITELVTAIGVMFSRQNEGIDTRDLYNFLNFNRMTSYAPHCGLIEHIVGDINAANSQGIMTAMTLAIDKDNVGVDVVLPYAKQGLLPEGISEDVTSLAPVHLVTRAYPFNDIADRLKAELKRLDQEAAARTVKSTVMSGMASTDDFLVL